MKKIKTKLVVVVFAMILSMGLVIGAVSAYVTYSSNTAILKTSMMETAKTAAIAVTNGLDRYKVVAQEAGLNATLAIPEVSADEKSRILEQKAKNFGFVDFNIVDLKGSGILYDVSVGDREYFRKAVQGITNVSDVLVHKVTGKINIIVAAPLWEYGRAQGKVIGVVYFAADVKVLTDTIKDIKIGENGGAYMLDQQGTVIAYNIDYTSVTNKENTIADAKQDKSLQALAKLEEEMIQQKTGFGDFTYNKEKQMIAYTPVGLNNWSIAVEISEQEFMGGVSLALLSMIGLTVLGVLIVGLIMYQVASKISKPIVAIEQAAKKMQDGLLDVSIDHAGKDEVGALAVSFSQTAAMLRGYIQEIERVLHEFSQGVFNGDKMMEMKGEFKEIQVAVEKIRTSLSHTLAELDDASEQVANGSAQVASGAQLLSQGATEQASTLEELAAKVTEITETGQNTAVNIDNASQKINAVSYTIEDSHSRMQEMMRAMQDIKSTSNEISKIIKTIEDIAFQTNILALNAAVEAARAGASGKGFAVVADEVRRLANMSAQAANTSTELIEASIKAVEEGSKISRATAEKMKEVVQGAEEISLIVTDIAYSTMMESMALQEVNQGFEQISNIVQTTSATAEQSAATSEELSSQAQLLKTLVGLFVLESAPRVEEALAESEISAASDIASNDKYA